MGAGGIPRPFYAFDGASISELHDAVPMPIRGGAARLVFGWARHRRLLLGMPTHVCCFPLAAAGRALRVLVALLTCVPLACGPATAQQRPAPPRYSQAQVAGQFLRAVLRADYAAAHGRLAPEVRRAVSPAAFETAARPLWRLGRRAAPLELYKLGVRLGDGGTSRLFYSFMFTADSALPQPSVLFEVTFRDTAARSVLGFGLGRIARRAVPQTTAQPSTHR